MCIFIKSVLGRYLNLASTLAFQNESSLQSFIFSLTKEHPVSLIKKTPYPLYRFKNIKRTCFKTEADILSPCKLISPHYYVLLQ